jgi:hypothetical protein
MTVHVALHKVFPAKKQRGKSPFVLELHRMGRANGRGQVFSEESESHEDEVVKAGMEKEKTASV